MVKVIQGKRAGKNGKLAVGCSAAVFDESHERLLLIRRTDDGKWAMPGGYMEAGEDFSEACAREVFEETGLQVKVQRLISIYTAPNLLLEKEMSTLEMGNLDRCRVEDSFAGQVTTIIRNDFEL